MEKHETERPVLLLLADASDQFDIALRHESATATTPAEHATVRRALPPTAVLVAIAIAATFVVVIVAALITSQMTAEPSFTPMPKAAPTTTSITTTSAATVTSTTSAPAIPVVDVNSLPPARSR